MKIISKEKIMLREGHLSLWGNVLLFALKFWAGITSSSAALIADAWHTLSDSISSIIIMIAAKVSGKKADEKHPFGHGRAELIAALIVGVLLFMIAMDFFIEGIDRLNSRQEAQYGLIAIIVTGISIIIKESMAQYALWAYKKCHCLSLKADAWHHRSDAISSIVLLFGIFLGRYVWWADGVLTLLISIMIAWAAFHIIRDGIKPLMGETPDEDFLEYLGDVCDEILGRKSDVHHVHIHRYGDHIEITFHLRFPKDISLKEVHDFLTRIEMRLKEERDIEATIHPEPEDSK
jgi:cation diffusion facilitator family transporter